MKDHRDAAHDQVPNLGIVEGSKDVTESSTWHGRCLSRRSVGPLIPGSHRWAWHLSMLEAKQ